MKKYFFIQKRQIGKTSIAIYEYIKSPKTTILACNTIHMSKIISERVKELDASIAIDNIISVKSLRSFLSGRPTIKRLILDEYMIYDSNTILDINQLISTMDLDELLIYSTSNKMFDTYVFKYIRDKKNILSKDRMLEVLSEELICDHKSLKKMVDDLYYNIITDSDTELITTPITPVKHSEKWKHDMRHLMNMNDYNLEIENNFLSNILSEVE